MRQEDEKTRSLMQDIADELRRHTLVLHEEVIGRIALLQEARPGGDPGARRRPKR